MAVIEQERPVELEPAEAPAPDPVTRTLEETLAKLERDGWCQGELGAEGGKRCLLGALIDSEYSNSDAFDFLQVALGSAISRWNDHPDRTFSEVRAKLQELIEHRRQTWQ